MIPLLWLFGGLALGGLRDPRLAAAAACAFWLAAMFGARASRRALLAWAPFLAWLLVSTLASDQPWQSAAADARWAGLALFCGFLGDEGGLETLRRFWLPVLSAAAVVLGLAGLWTARAWIGRGPAGQQMWGLLPPYYNYTAFVIEAAAAACAAALLAPMTPQSPPDGRQDPLPAAGAANGPGGAAAPPGARRWLGGVFVFCALWLAFARSRGALLAAALAIALSAWRNGRLSRRRAAAAGAAGLALAMAAMSGLGGARHWLKLDQPQSFKRPQIWTSALRAFADRPFFGWGPGNFLEGFLRHNFPSGQGLANYQFSTPLAHSVPLSVLGETGLVGLLLLFRALGRLFAAPRPSASTGAPRDWRGEAAWAAAVAMGAHCLIDDFFQLPALAMLFLSACALARGGEPRDCGPLPSPPGRSWPIPVLVAGLSVAVLGALPAVMNARLERAADRAAPPRRLELLRARESLFPADANLREDAARAALELSPPDPDAARAELAQAERLDPTNALYRGLLAELAASERRWPEVEEDARRASSLEPNYLEARLLLARALSRQGRPADAAAQLAEFDRSAAAWKAFGAVGTGYERELARFDPALLPRLRAGLARR